MVNQLFDMGNGPVRPTPVEDPPTDSIRPKSSPLLIFTGIISHASQNTQLQYTWRALP